jgi:hypothetical protein
MSSSPSSTPLLSSLNSSTTASNVYTSATPTMPIYVPEIIYTEKYYRPPTEEKYPPAKEYSKNSHILKIFQKSLQKRSPTTKKNS